MMDLELSVTYLFKSAINQKDLDDRFDGDLNQFIDWMVEAEGLSGFLFGCMEVQGISTIEKLNVQGEK